MKNSNEPNCPNTAEMWNFVYNIVSEHGGIRAITVCLENGKIFSIMKNEETGKINFALS